MSKKRFQEQPKENFNFLLDLRDFALENNLVNHESVFCTYWLNRAEAYFRNLKHRSTTPTADTMAFLAHVLKEKAKETNPKIADVLLVYADRCYDYIREKAKYEFEHRDKHEEKIKDLRY